MAEFIKERLYPVSVAYKCGACEIGEMEHVELMGTLLSYPAQYPHKCNNCECQSNFFECYPKVKYITKDELIEKGVDE